MTAMLLGLAAAGVILLSGCNKAEPLQQKATYVDAGLCHACHGDIYKKYRETAMARSFFRLRPENSREDFASKTPFYHRASDSYFSMSRRDGRLFQRRHQIGFDGRETNILEKEVHYVIGSGRHARTFVHQSKGRWLELPLARYSENSGTWAMNPGYDRPDHEGFRRRITYECVFCHTGYPEVEATAEASGGDPVFSGRVPEGIDCQRCHGPGGSHVAAAQAKAATPETIRSAIVNPARLTSERQLEICMQCHLESTSFRLPYSIRRFERSVFSYRPGEPLADYILHFDHAPGTQRDDKFEIAHQAYRLRKSACFEQSMGKMTCTTCHDPHSVLRDEAAARHYATVCESCHKNTLDGLVRTGRHTASRDCVPCHMPKRRAEDVVHVVMTDHHIQRRKPQRDLVAPLDERHDTNETAYRGEVALYYPPRLTRLPEDDLYLAVAQVRHGSNLSGGVPLLEGALERIRPARGEFYFELAEAYQEMGKGEKAIAMYEASLERMPEFRPARYRLGAALAKSGQLDRAGQAFARGLANSSAEGLLLNDLALVYRKQGRLSDCIATLRRALGADPDLPQAYNNLGGALLESGDAAGGEAAFRDAIRIQPDLASARYNLARLLAGKFEVREAAFHLEKAIAIDAKYAQAHHALGDLCSVQGKVAEAIKHYRRAVEIDPEYHEAHLGLANALTARREIREALAHFRKAAESPDREVRDAAQLAVKALSGTR